jgi:hypothetical protein
LPFARISSPSQIVAVRKLFRAVESKEVDQLSTEERQQIRGLMFAPLDESSSLSRWFSLAPSLLVVCYRVPPKDPSSHLTELHAALQTSCVRDLSLVECVDTDFRWSSFFELSSLRTVQFHNSRSIAQSLANKSKVLHHLLVPFKGDDDAVSHYSVYFHSWKRVSDKEEFALSRVSAYSAPFVNQSLIDPTSVSNWIQDLAEVVQASSSLTDLSLDGGQAEVASILPHSSLRSFRPGYCRRRTRAFVDLFASALLNSPSLTNLVIFPDTETSFSPLLLQLPSSNIIDLSVENGLNENDWRVFSGILSRTRLSSLFLDGTDSPEFDVFCSALPQINNTLTSLSLVIVHEDDYQIFHSPSRSWTIF